ncbi:MAG: hypothetical protein E4G99_03480 [Anaerolineales bacterium]|nr:MAG: hypothetical protein E4G99_03480 [Anaerolineales bacterium]
MSKDHLPLPELRRLSAYMDGELSPREARKVAARLESDPGLQQTLRELQVVARSLRSLPQVRPPRSFILSPAAVGVPLRAVSYPALRLATMIATFVFVAMIGVDIVSNPLSGASPSRSFDQVAAEAPAMAESETLGAAKIEPAAEEALQEQAAADMLAGAELPVLEADDQALAGAADTAAVGESGALEEGMLLEQTRTAEAQMAEPQAPAPAQDRALSTQSATEQPPPEAMANQLEFDEDLDRGTSFAQTGGTPSDARFWLRGFEIGLGGLVLILGALTLWARKRPG